MYHNLIYYRAIEILQRYGGFLVQKPLKFERKTNNKSKFISSGTAIQYLSGIKDYYFQKFPNWPGWISCEQKSNWYIRLRHDITRVITKREIEDGNESLTGVPITQADLEKIIKHLLVTGTNEEVGQAIIILTNYHAIGRTGEIASAFLNWSYWNEDEKCLVIKWYMSKVVDNKVII